MKKIISLISALIMCCSSYLLVPSYAEETDYNSDVLEAIEILRMFNIIPEYYDYNVDVTKETTRGDFASATAKLLGIEDFAGDGIYYYDVPQSHWAYDQICALTDLGILNGHGDKMFHPNNPIKQTEACKILLSALGYKEYAEASGGYPGGYTETAATLEMLDGVSSSVNLTLADSFMMLCNAMKINIMRPTASGGTTQYETTDDTVMSFYKDIYFEEGRVTGAEGITLDAKMLGNPKAVEIDGEFYDDSDVLAAEYLGQTVEFFYHFDKKSDTKKIIWMKSDGKTDTELLSVNNDAKFNKSSFELTYFDEDRGSQKTIKLDKTITVIYNGGIVTEGIDDIFNLPRYTLKLIENERGDYGIAIVRAYKNVIVDGIDKNYMTVNNRLVPGERISLDPSKYNKMTMTIKGEAPIEFDALKKDYVLSIYQSKDGKFIDVVVNAETVSGKVNGVEEADNGYKITVGDDAYYAYGSEGKEYSNLIGNTVVGYLDVNSEIVLMEISEKNFTAAYLIKPFPVELSDDGLLRIKLLKDDGTVEVYPCAEKFKVDGDRVNGAEEILRALSDAGSFVPQVCLIDIDQAGMLTSIDTVRLGVNEHIDTSISVSVPYGQNYRWRKEGYLGAKSVFNSETVILSVPAKESDNEEDYQTAKISNVAYDTYVNAETYKIGEEVGFDDIILLKGYNFNSDSSAARTPVLVESFSKRVNSDGEAVEAVSGYQGKAVVSFVTDSDVTLTNNEDATKNIKPGMMVDFITNRDNEIIDYKILYDFREPTARTATSTDINAYNRSSFGYVYNVVDGVVKFGFEKPGAFDQATNSFNVPVLVYDTKGEKNNISVGSVADARTYVNELDNCSKVFMYSTYTIPYLLVIFN